MYLDQTTAIEMARAHGVDPKRFRAALRSAGLGWHSHNGRWEVTVGSPEHGDMERVMSALTGKRKLNPRNVAAQRISNKAETRDETYVVDLCDEVLGLAAQRQHCFPFLVGDQGQNGTRRPLPVDAFYPTLMLVVEYHERQHTERVGFFDDKLTVSGVSRGEQRRRYDELRKVLLPQNGYALITFDYSDFAHDGAKKLLRNAEDKRIISQRFGALTDKPPVDARRG